MSKVRPTNPLDQLDLGFGSGEDLKPKKQTPLKTGPSPFDGKLEKAVGSGRAIYYSTDPAGSSSMGIKKMPEFRKGGKVKAPSASKRADGIAQRGKTRGRMV